MTRQKNTATPPRTVVANDDAMLPADMKDPAGDKAKAIAEFAHALKAGALGSRMDDKRARPYVIELADGTKVTFN